MSQADRPDSFGASHSAARIPLLMYHSIDATGSVVSVSPRDFEEQMQCLADQGFRGITLREAVSRRSADGRWPARSVVLTFDDGYANVCDALPVLQRQRFGATVFVVSGHMGGANDWAPTPPGLGAQAILSPQQARDLAAAGIEIGAHTHRHCDLRQVSIRQAEEEIVRSRAALEGHIGLPVESFAYPFGSVTETALAVAQREFRAACTTVLKRAANEAPHQLPRIDMYYIRSRRALERLLCGGLDWYLAVRRWGRAVRRVGGKFDGP